MTLSAVFAYYDGLRERIERSCNDGSYEAAKELLDEYKRSLHDCFNHGINEERDLRLVRMVKDGLKKQRLKDLEAEIGNT